VSGVKLSLLIAVFFFTSAISVVTGSTSLITVPVMIALGIEAHGVYGTTVLHHEKYEPWNAFQSQVDFEGSEGFPEGSM
jgi:hypothetical protein